MIRCPNYIIASSPTRLNGWVQGGFDTNFLIYHHVRKDLEVTILLIAIKLIVYELQYNDNTLNTH